MYLHKVRKITRTQLNLKTFMHAHTCKFIKKTHINTQIQVHKYRHAYIHLEALDDIDYHHFSHHIDKITKSNTILAYTHSHSHKHTYTYYKKYIVSKL